MVASTSSNVAQAVARCLCDAGVRRIYGVTGEDHLRLLHECESAGLSYVLARDENAAALMAAAESQATGLPSVVVTTLAPGITNALNGLASAYLDHLPVILICGQHDPDRYSTIVRQGLDNHAVARPLTKWTAVGGRQIHQLMAKVIDTAMAPPRGPIFLELRAGVAAAEPTDEHDQWPILFTGSRTIDNVSVDDVALAPLRELLVKASNPVVIVGGRAQDVSTEALAQFASTFRVPVFASPAAKGCLGRDHPWFAGTFLNGNVEAAILERADAVLAVGLDAFDYFNVPWTYRAPIVAIESDRTTAEHFFPVTTQIVADPSALFEALVHDSGTSTWSTGDVRHYRDQLAKTFEVDANELTIPSAITEARRVLPASTFVTIDAGFGKPLHSLLWEATEPNSCFSAQGLSTMGYALPAANALKLAFPDRPVVGFMGDGSLLMRATEISVACELELAPIYVVWADSTLSQIEIKQRRQGLRNVGANLGSVSYPKIADAFGATGYDARTKAELRDALLAGLSSKVPTLIGAHVDQTRRDEWFEQLRG